MVSYAAVQLDDLRIALPLPCVERVVRAVAISPLPQSPELILGIVDFHGLIVPVVNLRRRFRLPERKLALTDQLILARTPRRPVALVVDAVSGIFEVDQRDMIGASAILPGLEYIEGVFRLGNGLIFIHNLERFLSLEEEDALDCILMPGEEA